MLYRYVLEGMPDSRKQFLLQDFAKKGTILQFKFNPMKYPILTPSTIRRLDECVEGNLCEIKKTNGGNTITVTILQITDAMMNTLESAFSVGIEVGVVKIGQESENSL